MPGLAGTGRGGMRSSLSDDEQKFLRGHRSHDVDHVIRCWKALARQAGWTVETVVEQGGFPVVVISNACDDGDGSSLYLSAGIHGDEPAGVAGLLRWAEENAEVLSGIRFVIFPCLNPWGLAENCRLDAAGRDLNRMFDEAVTSPIREWREFMGGKRFDVAAMLHEDYDAHGTYLYELTRRGRRDGDRLLAGVDPVMPRHEGRADGQKLQNGIKRRTRGIRGIAETIDGMAEAIHLYLEHAEVTLTFETPSEFSLYRRVEAQKRFLDGVAGMLKSDQ